MDQLPSLTSFPTQLLKEKWQVIVEKWNRLSKIEKWLFRTIAQITSDPELFEKSIDIFIKQKDSLPKPQSLPPPANSQKAPLSEEELMQKAVFSAMWSNVDLQSFSSKSYEQKKSLAQQIINRGTKEQFAQFAKHPKQALKMVIQGLNPLAWTEDWEIAQQNIENLSKQSSSSSVGNGGNGTAGDASAAINHLATAHEKRASYAHQKALEWGATALFFGITSPYFGPLAPVTAALSVCSFIVSVYFSMLEYLSYLEATALSQTSAAFIQHTTQAMQAQTSLLANLH